MSLVLIADDDNAARVQLKRLLEKAGHKVVESATARQALEEATEHEPDLILLDIRLPGKDPLELLEEIRAESSLSRVPIMVMAEEADGDVLKRTFRWDIVDFIHKPFDAELLVAKIGAHTRLNLAYKFSRKLSKEMYMSRIDRLETELHVTEDDITEAERHFTWMQPKAPKVEGYRIEVVYRPYDRLGGDFYDFIWLDHDRLAVVVGDVSGHGIQAAILQVMARKLISLALRQEDGVLGKVIAMANFELTNDLPPGSFVAAMVGILDTSSHTWKHVRCGVPYPMLIRGREVENIVTPGSPLGLSSKEEWASQIGDYQCILEPDHTMLMMSDGAIETYLDDEKHAQFEAEGVEKAIKETPPKGSFVDTIFQAANCEQHADDDVTIITIARL